ncbi:MAG: TraV family lipoprotein [Gammaproteobacteria bacterium]
MRIAITGIVAALAACSTTPQYACGARVSSGGCRSVSSIHSAAISETGSAQATDGISGAPVAVAIGLGEPVMSAPRTLRIQVQPYQDGEGDLHGASFLYVRIGDGEWTSANGG